MNETLVLFTGVIVFPVPVIVFVAINRKHYFLYNSLALSSGVFVFHQSAVVYVAINKKHYFRNDLPSKRGHICQYSTMSNISSGHVSNNISLMSIIILSVKISPGI